ncbi:MAG: hypothetical protein LBQ79_00470 [Deltaproteobacteria bacterium]|jgi:hypothetical protein|nr:hypothetical protein [Deltaproteobacteria bacterium]
MACSGCRKPAGALQPNVVRAPSMKGPVRRPAQAVRPAPTQAVGTSRDRVMGLRSGKR